MAAALFEADLAHQLGHPFLVRLFAREGKREDDVLLRVQHRKQIEELEDEADVLSPQVRQLIVVQVQDRRAGDGDLAGGRLVQTGENVHQRRLPGAGGPHDCSEPTLGDLERDAA